MADQILSSFGEASAEMPRYKCHKEVHALKIKEIKECTDEFDGVWIVPDDPRYGAFIVSRDYFDKHKPQVGGYYVVYDDGYKSYSPAKAFEEGYTLIK